jgi:hypothetical protein
MLSILLFQLQPLKMLRKGLSSLALLFLSLSAFGQILIEDGEWHRVEFSGTFQDFKLSSTRISNYPYLQFRVVGADGMALDFSNTSGNQYPGGQGAMNTLSVRVNPFYGHSDFFTSDQTFRFIVGGTGVPNGGGGGGGSAVLVYTGETANDANTSILVASGGGGGAGRNSAWSAIEATGVPGSIGEAGTWGYRAENGFIARNTEIFPHPGPVGQGAKNKTEDFRNRLGGNGGGAFSKGEPYISGNNCTRNCVRENSGEIGMLAGGRGGIDGTEGAGGGYGFGGGGNGLGNQGGGGGGGYSGGAQGVQGGGGGGGSFVSSAPEVFSLFTEQTAFGTTMESQNGYIEYRFLDYAPIARCRDIFIDLDQYTLGDITSAMLDNGSSSPYESISLSVEDADISCQDGESPTVTLVVTGDDTQLRSSCQSTISTTRITCVPQLTLSLDETGNTREITTSDLFASATSTTCGDYTDFTIAPRTLWGCWGLGDNPVTLTANDPYGNVVSCASTVTVVDNISPTAICRDRTIALDESGEATVSVGTVDGGSFDNCSTSGNEFSVAISGPTSFDCSDLGDHTVTLTITDHVGMQDQCTATVTVIDDVTPILNCPQNQLWSSNTDDFTFIPNLSNDGGLDFNLNIRSITEYNPFVFPVPGNVYDNCTPLQITNDYNNLGGLLNAEFPLGETVVTYTVTDPGNNTVSCSFTVNIVCDQGEAPELVSCPPQLQGTPMGGHPNVLEYVVEEGTCGRVITYGDPIFNDCDDFTVSRIEGLPSGATFPVGTTDLSFRAQDEAGNRSDNGRFNGPSCVTRIIIREDVPPVANCKESLVVELDSPLFVDSGVTIRPSDLNNGSFDECGGGLTLRILEDGIRYVDWVLFCDDYEFRPLTLEVTDQFGNSSTCETQVKLGEQPTAVCKDIEVDVRSGSRTIAPLDVYGGPEFGPCIERFPPTLSLDRNTFGCSDIGAQTVVLTLTDVLGVTTTCTSELTVVDGGISSLNCGTISVVLEEGDQQTIDISDRYSASDACGEVTVSAQQDIITVDCSNFGSNLIPVTATDQNGNTASCNVNVQVSSPTWSTNCEDFTVFLDQNNEAVINHRSFINYGNQCSTDPRIAEYNEFLRYNLRNFSGGEGFINGAEFTQDYTFTLTQEDLGGNTMFLNIRDSRSGVNMDCFFTITVAPNTPPTAICQDFTAQLGANDMVELSVDNIDNGSFDDTGGITMRALDVTTFGCGDLGEQPVVLTVTDFAGLTATCNATVTVVGQETPTAVCQDVNVSLAPNGLATVSVNDLDNGSFKACSSVQLSLDANEPVTTVDVSCADLGASLMLTLYVNDENGNQASCSSTITVRDNVAPTARCVSELTVNLSDGPLLASQVNNGSTDNCTSAENLTLFLLATDAGGAPLGTSYNFGCSEVGAFNVTLEVTDASNNRSSCDMTLTVVEDIPPTAVCQDVTASLDGNGNATVTVGDIDGGSTDNCSSITFSFAPASAQNSVSFGCDDVGNQPVTLYVTDESGAQSSCTATVMVQDNMPPFADCQSGVVELDENGTGTLLAADLNDGSTDNCGVDFLSFDQAGTAMSKDYDCEDVGTLSDVVYVTDVNGNVAGPCPVNIVVRDVSGPDARCQNAAISLDGNGLGILNVTDLDNSSSDVCGDVDLSFSPESILTALDYGCEDVGTFPVTLYVKDPSGNQSSCVANVTVDDEVPILVFDLSELCQSDEIIEGVLGGATPVGGVYSGPGVTDEGNGETFGFVPDQTGDYTVTYTYTTAGGCTFTEETTLTVVDCRPDIADPCVCNNDASPIIYDPVTGTYTNTNDGTFGEVVSITGAGGGPLPAGIDFRVVAVTGANGVAVGATLAYNQSGNQHYSIAFNHNDDVGYTITVSQYVGNTPVGPSLSIGNTCAYPNPIFNPALEDLYCPNAGTVMLDGTDLNGEGADDVSFTINGMPETEFNPTTLGVGTYTVVMTWDGAVGTTVPSGTPANPNEPGCVQLVQAVIEVNDTDAPVAICRDLTVQLNNAGVGSITVADVDNGSIDGCGIMSRTLDITDFSCTDVGVVTVNLTVTDINNNESSCTSTVTVTDNVAPEARCQNVEVFLDGNGAVTVFPDDINNGSTDACGINNVVFSSNPANENIQFSELTFGCNDLGGQEVVLMVFDNSGNMSSCLATVTVTDNISPEARCQNLEVFLDGNGAVTVFPDDVNDGSTDACGINNVVFSSNPANENIQFSELTFGCNDAGGQEVVLMVFDNSGNMSSCVATVTVTDNVAPEARCQNVEVFLDGNGVVTVFPDDVNDGSTDVCGINNVVFSSNPANENIQFSELAFGCNDVGGQEVVLMVFDNSGNMSSCTATVTVEDEVPPVAICQNVTVQLDNAGSGSISAADVDNGSNDACGIQSRGLDISDFTCADVGEVTVRLTVTDNNDNVSSCTATVTVEDNVAPVAICRDLTVQLDNAGAGSISVADVDNGSNDACGILTRGLDITDFSCADVGAVSVRLTVTDNNGNGSSCTSTVTVEDNVAPVAICQNVAVQLDNAGAGSISAADVDNGSNDACGIGNRELDITDFTCADVGEVTVRLTVTDSNENVSSCTATVTVEDNVSPVAICQNVTVQLDDMGNGSITADDVDNGSNDACGIRSWELDITDFSCADVGPVIVTLMVTDNNDNVSSCTATVTVGDNVAPVAICRDLTVQLDNAGAGSISVADVDNGSNDACGIGNRELDFTDFSCADVGAVSVRLTVTDNNGNGSSCTSTVTVEDNVAPVAICQNVAVQLDNAGAGSISAADVDNGSNDACGIGNRELDITDFTCADVGEVTVRLTVTDSNDNVSSCTATVTVEDNVSPVAICQNVTVQLDDMGNGSITVDDVDNGSNDACGIRSRALDITDFTCADVGTVTVTLTVTDNNDNVSSCTSTITVEDNVPPVALCQDVTVQLDDAGAGNITVADVDNGSNDACGIRSQELDITDFSCADVGTVTVTLTVTDNNDNVSSCTSTVTVEDNVPPVALCQDLTVQLDDTGNGSITAADVDNGSNDACGIRSRELDITDFTCAEVGTVTVTLTVTDNNDNVSSCTSTVTVEDNVPPVALCQDLTVQLDDTGNGSITADDVDNGSNDACGIRSRELDVTDFTCADVGEVTVTLTVTDVNDNVNTCTSTVTVEDNIPPVITTTPQTVVLDNNGFASLTVADLASATDACGVASLTASQLTFGCDDIGEVVVAITATDVNGNVSTDDVVVTVTFVQPLLSCISELTVGLNDNCQAQLLPSMVLTGQTVCLSAFEFEIVVQDEDPSNGPIVDGCGRFPYTIQSVGTGAIELDFSGCWGFVTAIDRTPPVVMETPEDDVLLCLDFEAITLTTLDNNISRCWVVERNAQGDFEEIASTMAPTLRDRLDLVAGAQGAAVVPSFSDGCAARLQVCVSDVVAFTEDPDCDEIVLTRTFVATELSDCSGTNDPAITSFEISFVRPTLDDVEPAGDILSEATFECDEDFLVDANGNPLPRTIDLPFFTFVDRTIPLVVNETVCNIGLTYVDGPAIMNCPNSYTFVRVYTVLDWCSPGTPLTYTQVVKVEDTTAPVFTAPTQDRDFDGNIDDGPLEFGTNIGDECAAFIRLDDPTIILTDNCSAGIDLKADIYPFQDLIGAPIGTFFLDLNDDDAELAGPIPAGTHTLRYTYTDDCGNSDFTDVTFTVVDRTAPVAICEDGLNVSLTAGSSNGGPSTGSVVLTPEMLDNGSYDDCSEVTLRIGRVRQLVDGTYELLPGASYEEELLLTCADIGNVLVGLQVSDATGNVNYCWLDVLVEDKARPVCFAPAPVDISCIAYNAELPADISEATDAELDAAFGAATAVDNCGATVSQTISGEVNSCGVGSFTRVFTATDGQGLTNANACTQRITVYGIHDYTLTFPLDAEADCAVVPVYDSIGITERACDLITINPSIDTFRTTGTAAEECFKLEVTYDIINWCEYNSIGQAYLIPRDREGDRNPETELMYLHVRPGASDRTTADDIAWLSKFADVNYNPTTPQFDILLDNGDDTDGDDDDNGNDNIDTDAYAADDSRGFFRYVQFIKIYDEVEPVVNVTEPAECFSGISPDNCVAEVTLTFEAFDECSDVLVTVELDADYAGTPAAFERTRFLTNSEVVANGDDTYTVRLSDVPVGDHALRIRAGDGCGNFDVDILEFCVTPDKAPAPICIQTLTVTLMPDGNGGGMAPIWATDFIASDVTDCFGNVIDKYSIYTEEEATEAGFAPAVGRLGIDLRCEDFGEDVNVRVYAIDDAGNAEYCSAEVEVQVSEEDLCEERASVSGMIATQDDDAIGGVAVTLTGASNTDETVMTADNGQYEFASLEIGGDFSIFAEYDAEFDLTAVTVTDIVAITNHILGSNLLDTGYDHVAADVNMDAEVNIFDLVAMRRVILGLDAELNAEGITWRFVEGRYNLTPDNWMITFPEVYNVNNLPGNLRDGDFVGVELGNVVRPRGGRAALELKVDDAQLAAGQTHTIQIRNGELAGFQGTLELSAGLELLDVAYEGEGAMNLNRAGEGMIAMAFTGPALISLEVRATENLQVGDVIRLTDAITYREGTAANGGAGELSLHFEGDFAPAFTQNELFQNTPNPVSETTTIRFELAQAGPATLTLRDAAGRVVLVRNLDAVAGANQLELLRSDLGASGVLTYTLTAGEFIATKKMVVLR